jgi:hypothetical protein
VESGKINNNVFERGGLLFTLENIIKGDEVFTLENIMRSKQFLQRLSLLC